VDWDNVIGPPRGPLVELPSYPFQHRKYWYSEEGRFEPLTGRPGQAARTEGGAHAPMAFDELLDLVRAQAAAVLGLDDADAIDVDQRFADVGFESLAAAELRNRIAAASGTWVPATAVFDHPTPTALAGFLSGGADTSAVDFTAEVRLAEDITPASTVVTTVDDPRHLLLTGATGFLGAFLLRDLLRGTDAVVHCLVRGTSAEAASARLRANLRYYQLQVDFDRVEIVLGDLARPRFGLADADFDALARSIDGVYHAGGEVNWLQPYGALKAANVTGTEEVLRLATRHRTVPVHHISTNGVFGQSGCTPLAPDAITGPPEVLSSGYRQSKWVAEQLIATARARGLPVSVYRVDIVCGDQANGACQTKDFLWLSIKGLVQARAVPRDLGGAFRMVPADHVSAVVTTVSRGAAGGTFHVQNESAVSFAEIIRHLRSAGYQLDEVDAAQWATMVRANRDNALNPLLDAFQSIIAPGEAGFAVLDTRATVAASGIDCPKITTQSLERYLRFFVESGFLPEHTTTGWRRVTDGPARPRLVCLPSITPLGGPGEFEAWRPEFADLREVLVLTQPGFADDRQLPVDLDSLLAIHAASIRAKGDPQDFVLCGHSSGGWIAHALAERLAEEGRGPAGLVLLDTFWPDAEFHADVLPWALSESGITRSAGSGATTLAAADRYQKLLADWRPRDLTVPILFVAADQPLRSGTIRANWPRECDRAKVNGNHFTMMTVHGAEVARAVRIWLDELR
jgi:thioester reductase-like protein